MNLGGEGELGTLLKGGMMTRRAFRPEWDGILHYDKILAFAMVDPNKVTLEASVKGWSHMSISMFLG